MSIQEDIREIAEQVASEMVCKRLGHEYPDEYKKDRNDNMYKTCIHCDTTRYEWQEEIS